MARAGDLMIRVNFGGTDRLSRILDGISGSSRRAGSVLAETNRALEKQKTELRNVQRQMSAAGGNVTELIDRERALQTSIAGTTRQFEQQTKIVAMNARTRRASEVGRNLVASGQTSLFETVAAAAPLVAIAKAGAEFQSLQNRMKVLGLGDGAVKDLTAYAQAMNIAGSSANENLRYLLEAQGAFRETGEHSPVQQLAGAKLMAPIIAKMHMVAKASGKEMGAEEERYMLRFVEQAGGLSSPKRAAELSNGLFRALQSSGGNVTATNYQGFMARAGTSAMHLSNRAMFSDFEPLIGELHEQAGVGMASAYNRATGINANSRSAKEFVKLGLWDRSKVNFNSLGGVKSTNGNPLQTKAGELLAHDPVEFYRQIVLPAYSRAGINTGEQRTFENAKLLGGTGGKLFNLLDKQLPTILNSRKSYAKTETLDQAANETNKGFDGRYSQLKAAGSDFLTAAAIKGGLLDNMTSLLQSATRALRGFTAWGNAHPTAFRWIGTIVTDLLLLKGGLALTKIAFGGLLGPVARVFGLMEKVRAAGSLAGAFPRAAKGAGVVRKGGGLLARGAKAAVSVVGSGIGPAAAAGLRIVRSAAIGMAGGLRTAALAGFGMVRSLALLGAAGIAQGVATAFGVMRTAALFLGRGMLQAGAMMLANPLVLAIVAVGAAIGIVGYLVYRNWDTIKAAFFSGLATLTGVWASLKSAFSLGIAGVGSVLSGFGGMLGRAWVGIKSAFGAGVTWLTGLLPSFKGIGAMMLEGLLSMLSPGRLIGHIMSMGLGAISAFKKVLGIHSPSRVFMGLGGFMMQGLYRGIDAGANAPLRRVGSLATRLAGAMALPAAAFAQAPLAKHIETLTSDVARAVDRGSTRAGTASRPADRADRSRDDASHAPVFGPITIQIHAAPGQTPADIAREVERALDRLGRRAAADRRATFRDYADGGDR